jgi:hydrogenase large subunit
MTRVVVGPFNRVEGDLEVSLEVEAGRVREARVTAPLYRGFENLLAGRPALDALVIVPRICGICSVSQSAAAVAALAAWSGATMPANGRLASNLVLASEVLLDHLTHFYLFFMPDFARADYADAPWHAEARVRFAAQKGSASADFLPVRARFLTLLGILAGKWPHSLALRPGGTTRAVAAGEKMRLLALAHEMRAFLERHFFAARLEHVLELDSRPALARWLGKGNGGRGGDWPRFLGLAERLELERFGGADTVLLSAGAYPGSEGGALFAGGVFDRNLQGVAPLDPGRIVEDTRSAWYADAVVSPARGETRPQADKAGAYTWCKAPRYAGRPVETGAFARQRIAGQPLIAALAPDGAANVALRVLARGIEVARLALAIEDWIRGLDEKAPFHTETDWPAGGEGVGLIEAARGTLGHWLRVDEGKIAAYQIVSPTTWNFSPRDAAGVPGALEQALAGLPMLADGKPSVLVQHVVRSFDPCLACTVH